jgi:citrate lyase subunit beta/citryl-CoA lyase
MFERSFHFVPASRPSFFEHLGDLPADALIFDLEDAVPAGSKSEAIRFLKGWFAANPPQRPPFVRVNGADQAWFNEEKDLLKSTPRLGIVLPKIGTPSEASESIHSYLAGDIRSVILLVEDTRAVLNLRELTSLPEVAGIGIGFEDLFSGQMFIRDDLSDLAARIRSEVALHCAAKGIAAIDSISLDLTGGECFEREATAARKAGLTAMFSIHPAQLPAINRIFSPSFEQIAEARGIVALAEKFGESGGYHTVGEIILSPPKILKARAILEFAHCHEL